MPVAVLDQGANASISAVLSIPAPITIGFSWNIINGDGALVEVVPCAVVCGAEGRAISQDHVVFFNQMLSPDGSIQYDDNGGLPGGDNEQIEVDIQAIPDNVASVALVLYINPDLRAPGTFDAVRDPVVRVMDVEGRELIRYPIDLTDLHMTNAIVAADLYRRHGEWKLRAVGQGYTGGVAAVADDFGFLAP